MMRCQSCKKSHKIDTKSAGFWATLFLIVLPKCPFCLVAFSSTIALCTSSPDFSNHTDTNYTFWLVTCSGLLIAISMIMQNKGRRTLIAFSIAGSGMVLAVQSIARHYPYNLYYSGVSLIALGVWLNGSLISLIRFILQKLNPLVGLNLNSFK